MHLLGHTSSCTSDCATGPPLAGRRRGGQYMLSVASRRTTWRIRNTVSSRYAPMLAASAALLAYDPETAAGRISCRPPRCTADPTARRLVISILPMTLALSRRTAAAARGKRIVQSSPGPIHGCITPRAFDGVHASDWTMDPSLSTSLLCVTRPQRSKAQQAPCRLLSCRSCSPTHVDSDRRLDY
ncbi:hypothetical protein BS50DRAFT_396985 [Corynespora cassiicola Philippines]|uniref:Uncharacterized protein n=1 Tax=Corynespora cassiicola Philippines TaxID=1448308 RepID=A0A2T2NJX8_CORCC|nr:hypothetical protein BS50DRAFT_396985 [Corynespora cassiicola Philippines]